MPNGSTAARKTVEGGLDRTMMELLAFAALTAVFTPFMSIPLYLVYAATKRYWRWS